MRILFGLMALLTLAAPAGAAVVRDCGDDLATASARNIMEPWEKNSRTFYNGQVRVALIDTGGEPACCSEHLLIISPEGDEGHGQDACHLVSDHDNFGFGAIDFPKVTSTYDPKKGLLITFPYSISDMNGGAPKPGVAKVRVNLAKGTLAVEK